MKTEEGIQFISLCLFTVGRAICNILRHLLSQCWRVGGHKLWSETLKHSVMHLKTLHLEAEYEAGDMHTDGTNTVSLTYSTSSTSHHLRVQYYKKDPIELVNWYLPSYNFFKTNPVFSLHSLSKLPEEKATLYTNSTVHVHHSECILMLRPLFLNHFVFSTMYYYVICIKIHYLDNVNSAFVENLVLLSVLALSVLPTL